MTKPNTPPTTTSTTTTTPVCGAPTRAGTKCQNTLVTGCGRCPVHASQLRAAKQACAPAIAKPLKRKENKQYKHNILPESCLFGDLDAVLEQAVLGFENHVAVCSPVTPGRFEVDAFYENADVGEGVGVGVGVGVGLGFGLEVGGGDGGIGEGEMEGLGDAF